MSEDMANQAYNLDVEKQALKLTEALYRITDLFSDIEPLKWSLRDTGLKVLQQVSSGFENTASSSSHVDEVKLNNLIRELLLKIELASYGTFVSKKNFDVLSREYNALKEVIILKAQKKQSLILSDMVISDKVLTITNGSEAKIPAPTSSVNSVSATKVERPKIQPRVSNLNDRRQKIIDLIRGVGQVV